MSKTIKLIIISSIFVTLLIFVMGASLVLMKDTLDCNVSLRLNQSTLSESLYDVERKCEYETKEIEFSTNDKTKYTINDIDYGINGISSNYCIQLDEDKTLKLDLYTDYFHLSKRDTNLDYNISIDSTNEEVEIVVGIKFERTGEETKSFEKTEKIKIADIDNPVKMGFYFGS